MQFLRRSTSFLLFMVFVLSFVAEAFATEDLQITCDERTVFSSLERPTSVSVSKSISKATQKAPCADPCHFGQCHFGHCAFVLIQSVGLARNDAIDIAHGISPDFILDGPFLDGLRRPPRA